MLAELVDYHNRLVREQPGEIAPIGWCSKKVSYVLELSTEGDLRAIVPLTDKEAMFRIVPYQEEPTSQIVASFLCGNSAYFLGTRAGRNWEWSNRRFEAAKELHHQILDDVNSVAAHSILSYFDKWDTIMANNKPVILGMDKGSFSNGSFIFKIIDNGQVIDALDEASLQNAWDSYKRKTVIAESAMRCLVTGEICPVMKKHPSIIGVNGGEGFGAKLVSFNERSFESYGHEEEQGRNAPISVHAAEAYSIALNYLLHDENHHVFLGNTTVVYWSTHADDRNCQVFSCGFGGGRFTAASNRNEDEGKLINATMKSISQGKYRDLDGIDLNADFYIMGLTSHKSRLSVTFFLRNSFGAMLDNLAEHYKRLDVLSSEKNRIDFLTPERLLQEVEPKSKKRRKKNSITALIGGSLLESIIENKPYPQMLYVNALLRIHEAREDSKERKVTRVRAAIIRAYLIKNCGGDSFDERSLTVELNEKRNETAYCLGRAFSILEWIQETANGKATITNRYFNSASTTPSAVFPTLIHLSQAHLQKVKRDRPGQGAWLERQLNAVLGEDRVQVFPRRLTLNEQGDFILGYIHQKNKRYEPKAGKENVAESNEEE